MYICDDIKYLGIYDKDLKVFEGQYEVKSGISYNSYLILDKFNALLDTADERAGEEWLINLKNNLKDKKLDYIIVSHLEPDHSSYLYKAAMLYKDAKIVMTQKAKDMLSLFFSDFDLTRIMTVKENDTLNLGNHTLTFITAPMVHWPEVMMCYESTTKTLFSADAFGRFGDTNEDTNFIDEGIRYYANIVGKYGGPVQTVLKKASNLEIERICPLHGPILTKDLNKYIELYNNLSLYNPIDNSTLICYASMHGKTKEAALYLKEECDKAGINSKLIDLVNTDLSYAVGYAFKSKNLVILSPTYDGDIFSYTKDFLARLKAKSYKNRNVALVENGAWAPISNKLIKTYFEDFKDINIISTITQKVSLTESLKEELKNLVTILK